MSPITIEGLGADDGSREHQQFATRLAYGFPTFGDRLTVTPSLGLALSPYSSTASLLWALTPYTGTGQVDEPWAISLEGQRQKDTTGSAPVNHSLELRWWLKRAKPARGPGACHASPRCVTVTGESCLGALRRSLDGLSRSGGWSRMRHPRFSVDSVFKGSSCAQRFANGLYRKGSRR